MNWKFWKNWFSPTAKEEISPDNIEADVYDNDVWINQDEADTDPSKKIIPTVYITENLLERTRELLASFAKKSRSEGVVYWFGFELGEAAVVTTLVVPDADTTWGCIKTTPQANAQALSVIIGTPLILLGQAHSHPGSGVRHSEIDDNETFACFNGAISVVVPHFGKQGINLETCGIHRHINGSFQFIEPFEIPNHISLLPGEADFRAKAANRLEQNSNIKFQTKNQRKNK